MAQKQYEVLEWASLFLEQNNREKRVAEILLHHHLGISRTAYFAQMREEIPEDIVEKFRSDIERHVQTGVPVQHLMGYEQFYGRNFSVNPHVLIPRPETEELVQHVIENATSEPITIVDVGTGSGIIAITLALELPNANVYATDISKEALETAQQNAKALQADVTFLQGDFLQPVIEKRLRADIIVSNPPYIAYEEREQLSDTVVHHDPELALFADDHGLAAYKEIMKQVPDAIASAGIVAFEIGYEQGEAVRDLIQEKFPAGVVEILKDINGKDRIVFAKGLS